MNRRQLLRKKLVEQFTPYDSWEEFQHERRRYERGDYEEQAK